MNAGCDPTPVLLAMAEWCNAPPRVHQPHFHINIEDGLPRVAIPAQVLSSVLRWLLHNAFCSAGHGRAGLTARRCEGGAVQIDVSDSGPGHSPEALAALLEGTGPVALSDEADSLAACGRRVHQHGGRMDVDSMIGFGTTVRLVLPTL